MGENVLAHYGIRGMKWGVRRYQNKDGSLTPAGKKRYSEDESEDYKKAHSGKSVKTMSDAELRSRLNRLQMEQQYSKLSSSDVNKGKQFIDKAIKAGTTVAATTTTALTIYSNAGKIKSIVEALAKKVKVR